MKWKNKSAEGEQKGVEKSRDILDWWYYTHNYGKFILKTSYSLEHVQQHIRI